MILSDQYLLVWAEPLVSISNIDDLEKREDLHNVF